MFLKNRNNFSKNKRSKVTDYAALSAQKLNECVRLFLQCNVWCRPYGPRREKTCLGGFANNTGADQPAHTRSLISAFVIRYLESTVVKLAPCKIIFFYLISKAKETGLSLALLETPKTGFVATRPIL